MDHDRLLDLIDHPAPDADAPPDPRLTRRVMERLRPAPVMAPERNRHAAWLAVLVLLAFALAAPATGLLGDGGLGEAALLFDAGLLSELVAGAAIAAAAMALGWRRLV
jgi:hypothetical protein